MVEQTKMDIETLGFSQIINGKTRSWRGQQDSCIDHVWTNTPELTIKTINTCRDPSDHHVIGVQVRLKGSEGSSHEFYTRKRANFNTENYRQKLRKINWEELYSMDNLDLASKWLEDKLLCTLQEVCPLIKIQPSKKLKNWIKTDTLEMFKLRDEAKIVAKQTDTDDNWRKYKILRNKCNLKSKIDKKEHFKNIYTKIEAENNSKGLYKTVKIQLGWKDNGPPQSLVHEGQKITAPQKMADVQSNFFTEKIEKLMSEIPRPTENPLKILEDAMKNWGEAAKNRPEFSFRSVNTGHILGIINKMGNSSSFGHDFIDALSIKSAAEILAPPITFLTNLSLQKSKFAKNWKKSKVIPLHKGKGTSRTSPSSYRPVALLPTLSKIVEKVAHNQLIQYFESSGQLNPNLHGYRANYSTSSTLLQLSDAILQAVDKNLISTLLTVDESAAFDCVSNTILDKKTQNLQCICKCKKLDKKLHGK